MLTIEMCILSKTSCTNNNYSLLQMYIHFSFSSPETPDQQILSKDPTEMNSIITANKKTNAQNFSLQHLQAIVQSRVNYS